MIRLDRSAALKATALSALVLVGGLAAGAGLVAAATGDELTLTRSNDVPLDPSADAWEKPPVHTVNLTAQRVAPPFGGGSVSELDVRALSNETHIGFHLSWDDPTQDVSLDGPTNYSDAVAILLKGGTQPPVTMGTTGEPVDIWYWRASWQAATSEQGGDMYTYPLPDNETRPGQAAGNPLSQGDANLFAHDYYARGFGSLTHAPVQNVDGFGERTETGWQVTLLRERPAQGQYDVAFEQKDDIFLAFAVWDGSQGEVNGEKSITMEFTTMASEPSEPAGTPWLGPPPAQVIGLLAILTTTAWAITYWRSRRG